MFRNNIFDDIKSMEREIEIICSPNQCIALVPESELKEVSRIPVASIYETENSVVAAFELPGVEKQDIELGITEDSVEVKVQKKEEKSAEEKESYAHAIRSSSFYGSLPLPCEVSAESAEAGYSNGILRVEIPKAKKQEQRKKIEIK